MKSKYLIVQVGLSDENFAVSLCIDPRKIRPHIESMILGKTVKQIFDAYAMYCYLVIRFLRKEESQYHHLCEDHLTIIENFYTKAKLQIEAKRLGLKTSAHILEYGRSLVLGCFRD